MKRRVSINWTETLKLFMHSLNARFPTGQDRYRISRFNYIYSCGIGKIGSDFKKIGEWEDLGPSVTRCMLSPAFPAPFVEQTRRHTLGGFGNMVNMLEDMPIRGGLQRARSNNGCQGCGHVDGTKKCGGRESVYHCGRDYQRSDWKKHKPSCRRPH